jgi:hypothetical protein
LEALPALDITMAVGGANAEVLLHDLRTLHYLLDSLPDWRRFEQGALSEPSP